VAFAPVRPNDVTNNLRASVVYSLRQLHVNAYAA
jgi:hypothetical protein